MNLLEISPIREIFLSATLRGIVKISLLLLLLLIIISGIVGENQNNFATFAMWKVWFPLIYFSCILAGRIWCNFCPVGFSGEIAGRFSLGKKYPSGARNLWVAISFFLFLVILNLFIDFINLPLNTSFLLLSLTISIVSFALIFSGRVFCRYICPIGAVLGIYSACSISEVRCMNKDICRERKCSLCSCNFFEIPNMKERNNYCDFCGECVKKCDVDNIGLWLKLPFSRFIKADEAILVAILIGLGYPLILQQKALWKGFTYFISKSLSLELTVVLMVLILSFAFISFLLIYTCGFLSPSSSLIPLSLSATLAYNIGLIFPTAESLIGGMLISFPFFQLWIALPGSSLLLPFLPVLDFLQLLIVCVGYVISILISGSRKERFLLFLFASGYLFAIVQ